MGTEGELWVCMPADGFPRHRETWLCCHPENHKTVVPCSHPPHLPEGALRQRMSPDKPCRARRGGRKVDSPRRSRRVTRKQRRAPRGCSRTSLAFGAQSLGLQSIGGRRAQGRTLHPGKVTQSNVAAQMGAFVQRWGTAAVSGRLPLGRLRSRPLPPSRTVPPRCFLLASWQLAEAPLP